MYTALFVVSVVMFGYLMYVLASRKSSKKHFFLILAVL